MDDDKVANLIEQATKDGSLLDVLDWDVYFVRNDGTGRADEETWQRLKGKIIIVLSALYPEQTDGKPDLGAGVYSLDPDDARKIGQALIAFADMQNPPGGN